MDSSALLALFRSEMNDAVAPYLWSDAEFFSYADDAQSMFCRETDGIADDKTAEVIQLALVPGTERVDLHPKIKQIRSARRGDNGRPVEVINQEDMPERGWFFDGRQGPLKALVIGGSEHSAQVYPTSAETVDIKLSVFRLPLAEITEDGDQAFEIDSQHHRHLLLWCKHLAYSKQDAEAFDKAKAAEYEQKFYSYCANAKAEQQRARHKTRVVAYGGI